MKVVFFILFFFSLTAYGQGWRDTLLMARNAYKSEKYEEALSYYESAQKTAPDNVNLSDEMAQSAYKARKFDRAEKIYQQNHKLKESSKDRSESMHNLGNARMKQKNYQGAIEAYKDALRENPNDDETRYNLSEAIRQQKEEQKKQQNQQQNDQQNQDQQNDQQNNNGQNQQSGNQNNKGNNQDQNSNDQNSPNGNKEQGNQGTLQNKTVERLLDQLMKDEAETKRKMAGSERGSGNSKSGKDW